MAHQGLAGPGPLAALADSISLAYARELSSWALIWVQRLRGMEGGLAAQTFVAGVLFSGREVVKALLAELPLPRSDEQAIACRELMELLHERKAP